MTKKSFDELWPIPYPEVVVVTGPFGSGKSTFALSTGAAMNRTLVVDFEKSQSLFAKQLGFDYWDVPAIMQAARKDGYTPIDIFLEVDKRLSAVEPGKYDVLVLDNASVYEDGVAAYVEKFSMKFGLSANQLERSGGLKWGAVKNHYQARLLDYGSRFKIIFIIVHLRDKWSGNSIVKDEFGKPVQEPKGKETLELLSSLFVWLNPGPGGVPSANVLKCRVDRKVFVDDPDEPPADIPDYVIKRLNGEPGLVTVPVLPLRLPKATWPAIREYMRHPADLVNPKEGEVPSKKEMTEDDRLRLRSIISQNEAATAEANALKERKAQEQAEKDGKTKLVKELEKVFPKSESQSTAAQIGAAMEALGLTYSVAKHAEIKSALTAYAASKQTAEATA